MPLPAEWGSQSYSRWLTNHLSMLATLTEHLSHGNARRAPINAGDRIESTEHTLHERNACAERMLSEGFLAEGSICKEATLNPK